MIYFIDCRQKKVMIEKLYCLVFSKKFSHVQFYNIFHNTSKKYNYNIEYYVIYDYLIYNITNFFLRYLIILIMCIIIYII